MERAKTVSDAGYGGMLRLDESVWSVNLTDEDLLARYVDRRSQSDGNPKSAPTPVFDQLRRRLLSRGGQTFLTGQKGSGKSTELRRLLADAEIVARFERVTMVVTRWVDQGQKVDVRFVLLSLAAGLAEHIAGRFPQAGDDWSRVAGDLVAAYDDLLRSIEAPQRAPRVGTFKADFADPLVKALHELRGDDGRRAVLAESHFAVPRLRQLIVELLALIERGAARAVLLVVDDGDKLARAELARSLFIDHGEFWLQLPCQAVITYPYWLHFEPDFRPIAVQCQPLLLENIKVIRRDAPDVVLPGAVDFFRRLLDGMVEGRADLVDDDALIDAVRLGAGVPREFLRVLERGFMRAEDYGETRLTGETLRYTAQDLRAELIRMTQNEPVRRALIRVRLTKELRTHDDWRLLDHLLVIEHRNDRPWYDVHPLLASEADTLAQEYARRLGRDGAPASEAEVLRFLDGSGR